MFYIPQLLVLGDIHTHLIKYTALGMLLSLTCKHSQKAAQQILAKCDLNWRENNHDPLVQSLLSTAQRSLLVPLIRLEK